MCVNVNVTCTYSHTCINVDTTHSHTHMYGFMCVHVCYMSVHVHICMWVLPKFICVSVCYMHKFTCVSVGVTCIHS